MPGVLVMAHVRGMGWVCMYRLYIREHWWSCCLEMHDPR